MSKNKFFKWGWNADLPDHRDLKKVCKFVDTPASVDLSTSPYMPPVWDQGELGSCVAHASGAAFAFVHLKEYKVNFMPSRLFIYYNARVLENSVYSDDGCQIRDAIKQLVALGTCEEKYWEYNIDKFSKKPTKKCYTNALTNQVLRYQRVGQTAQDIESVLAEGYPVIFGMTVFSSLESASATKTGIVTMPSPGEKSLGGHAVLITGYDKETKKFKVRNSWSPQWGKKGYFLIDYDYVLNPELCDDFWMLQNVE